MSETPPDNRLMRELYRVEREERWDLYNQFRSEVGDYQDRMNSVVGDYYHSVEDDSGMGSIIVLERNTGGSSVGPHVYVSTFREDETRLGVLERNVRSIAIARHHYALRWKFSNDLTYNNGDPIRGLVVKALDEGPTQSHYAGTGGRHIYRMRMIESHSFDPITHWQPIGDERSKVRQVLREAIGIVSSLGYEDNIAPLSWAIESKHRR